ncbi:hypothetical protein KC325_g143 [Hortaea werneckii]|nr:hypothetical protein KC325_g143 [Hortaea werneckii]
MNSVKVQVKPWPPPPSSPPRENPRYSPTTARSLTIERATVIVSPSCFFSTLPSHSPAPPNSLAIHQNPAKGNGDPISSLHMRSLWYSHRSPLSFRAPPNGRPVGFLFFQGREEGQSRLLSTLDICRDVGCLSEEDEKLKRAKSSSGLEDKVKKHLVCAEGCPVAFRRNIW